MEIFSRVWPGTARGNGEHHRSARKVTESQCYHRFLHLNLSNGWQRMP
jgi:hypothetical protein